MKTRRRGRHGRRGEEPRRGKRQRSVIQRHVVGAAWPAWVGTALGMA
jgi:hypothetical protein